ncbi:MAG: glycosyltransferase family 2 protein [Bacteroidetes bacterium]|nr:glycosyltransferase family 2 protein [Bacteroidota bacterium]
MLAIVIPYFKLYFFRDTLESLKAQHNKNFVIYIGDDASPERPFELIKEYEKELHIKYHRFQNNMGATSLVKQWERCVALTGDEEWVMILGDDDVLDAQVVEHFYHHLTRVAALNIHVMRFSTLKINATGEAISEHITNPEIERSTDFIFRATRCSLSEYVFHKQKLLEVGFKNFPLGWASDKLAVVEVSNFSKIFSINQALVKIRISDKSISGMGFNKQKNHAMFMYYFYLLKAHGEQFDKNQISVLQTKMHKTYYNDKFSVGKLIKILTLYFKKGYFREFFVFIFNVFTHVKIKKRHFFC